MTLRVVTEPAYQPVTLAQAKEWARIDDDTSQDNVLAMLIAAMTRHAENLTGRAFIQRSLQLILDGWPCSGGIELPLPPAIAVSSIQYVDTDGTTQTLAASQYVLHDWREPAVIVPAWQVTWPNTRYLLNAVKVNYTAGYAPVGSPTDETAYQYSVPATLKTWIAARIATLYENREQIITGTIVQEIPRTHADGLLDELVVGTRLF